MRDFLRRAIVRIIAGISGVLLLSLAFLIWETSVVAIPESISKQVAWLSALPKGVWPIAVFGSLGVVLLLIAIGPAHLQTSAKWVSDWWRSKDRQIERLGAEKEALQDELAEAKREIKQLGFENDMLRGVLMPTEGSVQATVVAEVTREGPFFFG